jgi:hypothetical protein
MRYLRLYGDHWMSPPNHCFLHLERFHHHRSSSLLYQVIVNNDNKTLEIKWGMWASNCEYLCGKWPLQLSCCFQMRIWLLDNQGLPTTVAVPTITHVERNYCRNWGTSNVIPWECCPLCVRLVVGMVEASSWVHYVLNANMTVLCHIRPVKAVSCMALIRLKLH